MTPFRTLLTRFGSRYTIGMNSLLQVISDNGPLFSQHPGAIIAVIAATAGVTFAVTSYFKKEQIDNLKSRLESRDEDLKRAREEIARSPDLLRDKGKDTVRRRLILSGRNMIAEYNIQRTSEPFTHFVVNHPAWSALRGSLNEKVRLDLENGRLVVSSQHGGDGKVFRLVDELSRLEREWDLV